MFAFNLSLYGGETNNYVTVISCIFGLHNSDSSSSDYVASNDRIVGE
jgi:hypothetical protein